MKTGILNKFVERHSINSDSVKVFYTFTSGEGDIVWNSLYSKEEHYCDSNLLADKFPGLSIGHTDTPSHLIEGSGYFTRNDMLRVGSGIVDRSWTAFLDFGESNCDVDEQIKNVPEILISSMDNPTSTSGFSVGLNNSNKLFIEYSNALGERATNTLDYELADFNVISVSYSDFLKEFGLSYHAFPDGVDKNITFEAKDYVHNDVWHIGGMNNSSNSYTGYNGYIDDFLFLSESMTATARASFSEAFFVDQVFDSYVELTSGYTNRLSEVTVNPSGILGTKTTGDLCAPAITVEQKVGDDIVLYSVSDLTGAEYGTVVEFHESGSGWLSELDVVAEQIVYNTGELLRHSKKCLQFADAPTSEDIYEFHLFQTPKPNLNRPTFFENSRSINLLNTTYTEGSNINLYLNGIGQISGDAYGIIGLDILSNGFYVTDDFVYYDKIVGETFTMDFGGNSSDFEIDNSSLIDQNAYLNGQKLISGLNYTTNGSITTLYPSHPDGELSFTAKAEGITAIVTGNSSEKVCTQSVDELVWLNGVKQAENVNYFRVNECSLLDPSKKMKKQSSLIYNSKDMWQFYFGVIADEETEFKNF